MVFRVEWSTIIIEEPAVDGSVLQSTEDSPLQNRLPVIAVTGPAPPNRRRHWHEPRRHNTSSGRFKVQGSICEHFRNGLGIICRRGSRKVWWYRNKMNQHL